MTLWINGEQRTVADNTIAAALAALDVAHDTRHVAVAVNDVVVPRGTWPTIVLAPSDRIEIITAVAGG